MKSKIINRVRERQHMVECLAMDAVRKEQLRLQEECLDRLRQRVEASRAESEHARLESGHVQRIQEDAKAFNDGKDWFSPPKRWWQFWL